MVACDTDKEIAVFNEDSGAIKINAVIDAAYTRSNPTGTNEQQMQFNNGDQILLSCEDGSVTYMLSGGQWAPTDNYYLRCLFNIINRQVNTDIAKSMLKHCEQSVHHALPIWSHMANENWCMIGYHSVSVLADAIAKGLPIDKDAALKAMISSSTIPYTLA